MEKQQGGALEESEAREILVAVLRTAVEDCRAILAKDYVPSDALAAAAISAVRFLATGWGGGLAETLCGVEGRKNAERLARRTAYALGMTIDDVAAIPEQLLAQAVGFDTKHLRGLPKTRSRLRQGALRLGVDVRAAAPQTHALAMKPTKNAERSGKGLNRVYQGELGLEIAA